MWILEASTLLKELILWLMESGRPFTIGEVANFIKASADFAEELRQIRDNAVNETDGSININYTAFINLNNFLSKAEKEQSDVKSTLTARLNFWDNPLIQAVTEKRDFDIRDMRKKKMTITLVFPLTN